MANSVLDIANKLLLKPMWDDNLELISNLKLQKLLYYEQGYHLTQQDAIPLVLKPYQFQASSRRFPYPMTLKLCWCLEPLGTIVHF